MKTGIAAKIDEKRVKWFGPVKKMVNNWQPKILLIWKLARKIWKGRPKKLWKYNLTENLNRYRLRRTDADKEMRGIKDWKTLEEILGLRENLLKKRKKSEIRIPEFFEYLCAFMWWKRFKCKRKSVYTTKLK